MSTYEERRRDGGMIARPEAEEDFLMFFDIHQDIVNVRYDPNGQIVDPIPMFPQWVRWVHVTTLRSRSGFEEINRRYIPGIGDYPVFIGELKTRLELLRLLNDPEQLKAVALKDNDTFIYTASHTIVDFSPGMALIDPKHFGLEIDYSHVA